MTRAILASAMRITCVALAVATLSAFALFLAFAGDKLAGPKVQPLAAELVDMAEAAQLAESETEE